MRRALAALVLMGGLGSLWWLSLPSASTRAAWVADLERLERHTATAYANLGDRLASRHLSPRELDRVARAALARASSRSEARHALERFVAAFDDAHFRAAAPVGAGQRLLRRWLGRERRDARPIPLALPGDDACARFGAHDRRDGPIAWSTLDGFTPLDGDAATHPFPAGLLRRADAGPLAILRIGLFDAFAFPELCAAEWDRFRTDPTIPEAACDEDCRERFATRLERALLDRLDAELAELTTSGANTLLVDITGNGGGSGIVGAMTRAMTTRPIPPRATGFIRHPHSTRRLTAMAEDLRTDLSRSDLSTRQRALLGEALLRLDTAIAEAASPCDLPDLWSSPTGTSLPCATIGRLEPLAPAAAAADFAGLESRWLAGSEDGRRPGAWRGELVVLVDRRTASAAEDFAASLQDAGAARVAGERTMGVGCGYTDGGVTLELPATGLTVRTPDCVRFRADGRNEAEGVEPDLPIARNPGDDGQAAARRIVAAISS